MKFIVNKRTSPESCGLCRIRNRKNGENIAFISYNHKRSLLLGHLHLGHQYPCPIQLSGYTPIQIALSGQNNSKILSRQPFSAHKQRRIVVFNQVLLYYRFSVASLRHRIDSFSKVTGFFSRFFNCSYQFFCILLTVQNNNEAAKSCYAGKEGHQICEKFSVFFIEKDYSQPISNADTTNNKDTSFYSIFAGTFIKKRHFSFLRGLISNLRVQTKFYSSLRRTQSPVIQG